MITIALLAGMLGSPAGPGPALPATTVAPHALVLASAPSDSAGPALPAPAPTDSDDVRRPGMRLAFLAPDKLEHASLSFTAGLMIGIGTREPAAALGGSFALGLGKELWDRKRTFFDPRALMADLLGAAAAAWLTSTLVR